MPTRRSITTAVGLGGSLIRAIYRGEGTFPFLACEHRAPGTLYTRSVQALGVVPKVHEDHLLWHPVQDVRGSLAAPVAEALLAAQFLRQPAQARQSVGAKYAHD